jgi:hypothetical protein
MEENYLLDLPMEKSEFGKHKDQSKENNDEIK